MSSLSEKIDSKALSTFLLRCLSTSLVPFFSKWFKDLSVWESQFSLSEKIRVRWVSDGDTGFPFKIEATLLKGEDYSDLN